MARSEHLAALSDLLGQLFAVDELRRFAAQIPGFDDLKPELPDTAASPAAVTAALVEGLDRRGLLGREFFRLLRAERPRRTHAIDSVASLIRIPPEHRPPRLVLYKTLTIAALTVLFLLLHAQTPVPIPAALPVTSDDPPAIVPTNPPPPAIEPRQSIKIASDNQINAPGGTVTVIGIQGGP